MENIEKNAFLFREFSLKIGLFSRELSTAHSENSDIGRLTVSLNIVHDFTLFVADIHQIMLISLFLTPFDHFHFHPSAGLIS